MVIKLHEKKTYRIIPSRYPPVGIFDMVADPIDLETVILLEAATNPRILDEAGALSLVRPKDRISGPNTTAIMAAFTHTVPSRFTDGAFGVYYGAFDETTAIMETAHHRARFLRQAGLPNERLDMRMYLAFVFGDYDDIRSFAPHDPLYDPESHTAAQMYAQALHAKDETDGIVFRSVRRPEGICVAIFRPSRVTRCSVLKHLEYRFENYALGCVVEISPAKPA